ncbi:hypothetical protein ACFSSA_02280 [Luteolibacter algae]|uniref:DinB family protein n=1 Tax=Luteolibacter algae TaxID=454151 RepID=A0ABW5D476_9BACT
MANPLMKAIVRSRLQLTSSDTAEKQSMAILKTYLQLAQGLDENNGSLPIRVAPMAGLDDDMRGWSFFMLLRHNTIVNHEITATVRRLVNGDPTPTKKFDLKKDVMPSEDAGIEQIALFKSSVLSHFKTVRSLGNLKDTGTANHPRFGPLDALMWNAMFPFHLKLHLKQAQLIRAAV